ncbi:aspartate 1-decarboxylase, partial [Bacillus spizizenii]|nr:aspartate 1-decarboxylase [Bacillus spizizenii]
VQVGDVVIIVSYAMMSEEEAKTHKPKVAVLNEKNKIEQMLGNEPARTLL